MTTSHTRSPPAGYFCKKNPKKDWNGERKFLSFPLFSVYWQRLQLQILTRISEPLRQAFESKNETFIQMTTLGFASALHCLSTNTVLHCGIKKTPSMPLVFHYSPVKPNPKLLCTQYNLISDPDTVCVNSFSTV